MQTVRIQIVNKLGLHARAASKLAATCAKYSSKTVVAKEGKIVDGKSIMALMLLAAPVGTWLDVTCEGPDEAEAFKAVVDLINNRFDEAE